MDPWTGVTFYRTLATQISPNQAAHLTPGILQEVRTESSRCTAQVQKAEAILGHQAYEVVVGLEELVHDAKAFLEMHLVCFFLWVGISWAIYHGLL